MLSNSHSHYSAPRKTIYPINTSFRKEIFLNPKPSLSLMQPSKTLEPESRQSPNGSFTNDSVQKPRVLEAHASKQFSSGNFQTNPVKHTTNFQKDFQIGRGLNGIRIPQDPSESSSINKIPFSPIGLKQVRSNLITLNSDQKSDHLSTEPSVVDSNNHHTPPQYGNGLSDKKERTTIFGSDLKPPSLYRAMRGPQLSIGSMGDIEKRDSFRTPKARFSSDSKDFRSNMFTELPGDRLSIRPNPSTINSNVSTSTILGSKTGTKALYHSETMDRYTPPKISQKSTLDTNSNMFLSQAGNNSHQSQNKFRTNSMTFARSSQEGKKSSTSDELKKYIINLNQKFENFEASTWIKQVLGPNPRKDFKCNCDANLEVDKTCSRARKWISKKYKPEEFDYLKNTYEKIISEHKLAEPDQIKQIQKDIHRTYPESKLFAIGSEGIKTLERVLNAIAKFDPSVGYVQGMNFIAGSLLYHAEEYIAFWILVSMFEFLEMRDIFLPMLPGLSKHCQIIDMLILNEKPAVYSKLCEFQIRSEMYCSEWILTLFSSVVPITDMKRIFDNLFTQGWTFFYGLVLAFLDHFEKQLVAEEDLIGVLTILKSQNRMSSNQSKSPYYVNWKALCKRAQEFNINPEFISQMHMNFDNKNLWFRTTS